MNETFEDDGPFNWRKNENVEKEKERPATHFDWVEPSFATPMDQVLARMGDTPINELEELALLPREQMIYEGAFAGELEKEELEVIEIDELAISERGKDWLVFAFEVLHHIEQYTVPQYGGKGIDQCSEFSNEDFVSHAKKYLNRFGKNMREGQQELDLKKCVHFVQMLFTKITTENNAPNTIPSL